MIPYDLQKELFVQLERAKERESRHEGEYEEAKSMQNIHCAEGGNNKMREALRHSKKFASLPRPVTCFFLQTGRAKEVRTTDSKTAKATAKGKAGGEKHVEILEKVDRVEHVWWMTPVNLFTSVFSGEKG